MGCTKKFAVALALATVIFLSFAPRADAVMIDIVAEVSALQKQVRSLQKEFSAQAGQSLALQKRFTNFSTAATAKITVQAAQVSALQAAYTAQSSSIATLNGDITTMNGGINAMNSNVSAIMNSNVYALNPYLIVDTTDAIEKATGLKGPHVIFNGVNVHIQSGTGHTYDGSVIPVQAFSGLGNLIIGYNEPPNGPDLTGRGGSNNLIVGYGHKYESCGGFVGWIMQYHQRGVFERERRGR